jgi:putative membrane protein
MTSHPALAAASPWQWHAHPDVWLLVVASIGGYLAALRWLGPVRVGHGAAPATARQRLFYFAGVFALWLGADWPMHDLSERFLFSAHMVQHMLFTFVAPPLLLLGLPAWLLETLLRPTWLRRAVAFMTRPVIALIVFNGVIAVTHWPALVDLALRSELVHFCIHLVLFVTATLMWWPVVDRLGGPRSLSEPAKMLYLFMQSILPTVPASFLTFASAPIYRFYVGVPHPWVDVVTDQRIAGLIMKLGGGLLLWSVIATLFFRWNAREERHSGELITWDDFERELEAWDLRK